MSERSVTTMIEERGLGAAQIRIVVLCALVALLDGMDLQSIGLAAPLMAQALKVAPPAFGPVFSAALAGLAIGAFVLGRLADRVGRRRVLIGSTICFAVFTLCTAFADTMGGLLAIRFMTGFGLGGAMPSFISLSSEYVPRRMRATIVGLMWAGFPLGGMVGGLLASWLIPSFGWRSVFLVGGAAPLVLAAALALALPESLSYLVNRGAPPARIARELARAFGTSVLSAATLPAAQGEAERRARMSELFAPGRALGTMLLWVAFFFTFMILVTNSAWSPILLGKSGLPIARSAIAMAAFNFGSLFGSGAAGWLLARFGTLAVVPVSLLVSALGYALVGQAAPDVGAVVGVEGAFGVFAGCGSSALIALAAIVYPTAVRATGVGCATAAGRIGSFAGPLVVGALVGGGWPTASIFLMVGTSVLIGALAAFALGMRPIATATGEP